MRRDWLAAYADAWERADPGVVDLFTPDATYRSHPFRETHRGHDGIRSYWKGATATQSDARVLLGEALEDGDRVVVEWWTTMTDEGEPLTLPGVLLLEFDGDRCGALREYWAHEPGRHEPFTGWGRFEPGDAGVHAPRWADAYARAWRAGDADAARSSTPRTSRSGRKRSARLWTDERRSAHTRRGRSGRRAIASSGWAVL